MNRPFSRRELLAAGAGLSGIFGAGFTQWATAQTGAGPKPSVVVRIDREIGTCDPAFRVGPPEGGIIRAVYQRLMSPKANSTELELDAAAEVRQVSPTAIDFRLKPGQMFTDGFGEMTAEDVKFSFERIGLPAAAGGKDSPYKADWLHLVRVEVRSKYEGRIVLSAPRANVFDIAISDISGSIVSKKAVEQRGGDIGTAPVGSGAYQMGAYDRQKGVVLKRNPAYSGRKPHFDEISLRVISDPKTTELAVRAGEVDFALLNPTAADPLRGVAGVTVDDVPGMAFVWLGMNVEKGPLSDLRVRQAIRLGVDVDQMVLAGYNGKAPRLNTALPPQILGHWKEAPVYRRNVAEARRLLAAAGVTSLKLRLTILNQPQFQNMALVARALLAEIGITVDVDQQTPATFWNSGKDEIGKNLELYMVQFNGKHDPNFVLQWFRPAQIGVWNWSRWNSPDFERLYNEAADELDIAKRRDKVLEIQRLMDQTSAYVWLTNGANAVVRRSWLKPAAVPGWADWQYTSFGV
ncbi:MAG: ABC transporter substrate-binding protein [Rhodoferax sp.]|nr:ABC transporter substrate-binding protein [Rhodoferax sp.]